MNVDTKMVQYPTHKILNGGCDRARYPIIGAKMSIAISDDDRISIDWVELKSDFSVNIVWNIPWLNQWRVNRKVNNDNSFLYEILNKDWE